MREKILAACNLGILALKIYLTIYLKINLSNLSKQELVKQEGITPYEYIIAFKTLMQQNFLVKTRLLKLTKRWEN